MYMCIRQNWRAAREPRSRADIQLLYSHPVCRMCNRRYVTRRHFLQDAKSLASCASLFARKKDDEDKERALDNRANAILGQTWLINRFPLFPNGNWNSVFHFFWGTATRMFLKAHCNARLQFIYCCNNNRGKFSSIHQLPIEKRDRHFCLIEMIAACAIIVALGIYI